MKMKSIFLSLGTILLGAMLLYGVSAGLRDAGNAAARAEWLRSMQTLLPGSEGFAPERYEGEDTNIRSVYRGETGYVIETCTQGYAGPITMLIGVSNGGTVTGVQVRDLSETPGLGAGSLRDPAFLAQFLNTSGNAEVGANVDALTGATVTSRAIARSVNSAVACVTGADAGSGATEWGG